MTSVRFALAARVYRTILGAIVGLCVGLLLRNGWAAGALAVLGAFIGSRMDSSAPSLDTGEPPPPPVPAFAEPEELERSVQKVKAKKKFVDDVCALFVALAKVDGELLREEVRAARVFFEEDLAFTKDELEDVRLAIKAAIQRELPLEEAAARSCVTLTETERVLLVNALFEVALADGPLTSDEERLLTRAADALKIPPADLRTIFQMHLGTGEQHYRTLGVTSDISDSELKAAYRRLVTLHHPDRVAHLGAAAQERAGERFRDIQSAWEHVRRLRGL